MNIKHNLKIENFGPIKKADLEISSLTIFIGPNSSGKSYSAMLMHSLLNPFKNNNPNIPILIEPLELVMDNEELFEEYNSSFIEYLNSDVDFMEIPFKFSKDKFNDLICAGIGKYYLELKNNFSSDLNKLNNVGADAYFKINFDEFSLENIGGNLKLDNFFFKSFPHNNSKNHNGNLVLSIIEEENDVLITLNTLLFNSSDAKNEIIPSIVYSIVSNAFIAHTKRNSYYIPASSYAISYDLNSILSHEINGNTSSSIIDKELMSLLLNNKNSNEGYFKEISEDMSREILGGTYVFDDVDKGIKFIDEMNNEFEFPLVSSSIKELAPLIKY